MKYFAKYLRAGNGAALLGAVMGLWGSQLWGSQADPNLCCQAATQLLEEAPAAKGVVLKNISNNDPGFGSAYGMVAVNPKDNKTVLVGWRRYSWPIMTNEMEGKRMADCHVAISHDAGKSFEDHNLMDVLRTPGSATEPKLVFCNAPWAAIDNDGVMYAGGEQFTDGGVVASHPKQGRAGVSVSHDGGKTWGKMVQAMSLAQFAPGLKGIDPVGRYFGPPNAVKVGNMEPPATPWDNTMGIVDAKTNTLYLAVEGYFTSSTDQGKTFGTVYNVGATPDWPGVMAYMTAANGTLGIPFYASKTPIEGKKCPCLVFATSTDRGAHFTYNFVAESSEFNTDAALHIQAASDPGHPGHFAIAAFSPDHVNVLVYSTTDNGKTWSKAMNQPYPPGVAFITRAGVNGVAYTRDGRILTVWHGFRLAGAYDVYAAIGDGKTFGPTLKITPKPSPNPVMAQLGNGPAYGGDYTSWIAANDTTAFMLFSYSPGGLAQDTYLATIPLSDMR